MHGGIVHGVFAARGFPDQRGRVLAQALQCVLGLLGGHLASGFLLVEAQRLGIVGAETLFLFQQSPQHGAFQRLQAQVFGSHQRFVVALALFGGSGDRLLESARDAGKGAQGITQRRQEELRPAPEAFERGGQLCLIDRLQLRALGFDQAGDVGDEVIVEFGHPLDLRAVERRTVAVDQPQQLVAVGTGHHQHQVHLARRVELVAGGLERRHHRLARLTGQGVLCFVDDECDGFFRRLVQAVQGIGQGDAVDASDPAGVDRQCPGKTDAFQPRGLGRFGHQAQVRLQGAADRFGDQFAGVAALVGPQVHVHHHQPLPFQFRPQVVFQEGGLAGSPGGGQEQAVVGIAEQILALQRARQLLSKRGSREVKHGFIPDYTALGNLSLQE